MAAENFGAQHPVPTIVFDVRYSWISSHVQPFLLELSAHYSTGYKAFEIPPGISLRCKRGDR